MVRNLRLEQRLDELSSYAEQKHGFTGRCSSEIRAVDQACGAVGAVITVAPASPHACPTNKEPRSREQPAKTAHAMISAAP